MSGRKKFGVGNKQEKIRICKGIHDKSKNWKAFQVEKFGDTTQTRARMIV